MTISFMVISEYINQLLQQSNFNIDPIVVQSIAALIIFTLFIITGGIIYQVLENYFSMHIKKTKTVLDDDIIRKTKKQVYFFIILLGCYYAIDQFTSLDIYASILTQIFLIVEIFLISFTITRVINVFASWYAKHRIKRRNIAISSNILIVFKKLFHVVIYIFTVLFILYINKINLSGALISLGVGGIAIAYALQNVLSDAFSAFSIYFDRPFEIGNFIIVGEYSGTVTHIGMKSTRIQLLKGEELILSNKMIFEKSIRNFKKKEKQRIVFSIGITYDIPTEKLMKIADIINKIIVNYELIEVDMINFKQFGDFSLDFEIVYYIDTPDYKKYIKIQHQIECKIKEVFEKEKIDFIYPTQTILNKDSNFYSDKTYQNNFYNMLRKNSTINKMKQGIMYED